jgi:hypothetical protein
MRVEILHSHSVHVDLNLVSARIAVSEGEMHEEYQFYKLLSEVKANPMSLEDFIVSCKNKAIFSFSETCFTTAVSQPVAPTRKVAVPEPIVIPEPVVEATPEPVIELVAEPTIELVVVTKPRPVVEVTPEPVVEVTPEPVVEVTPEPVVEVKPVIDSISRMEAVNQYLKEYYKTIKEFSDLFGTAARKGLMNCVVGDTVDHSKAVTYLEAIKASKVATKAEKEEIIFYTRTQPTEMLSMLQRSLLVASFGVVSAEFPNTLVKPPFIMASLDALETPVRVATRQGNGEYIAHPELQEAITNIFQKKSEGV